MNKQSKKSDNGVPKMQTNTRDFFTHKFVSPDGTLDALAAASFFGVAERTIYNWWRHGCPAWVDRFVLMAQRALPDTKDWRGFRVGADERLYTPVKNLSFSADELMEVWEERHYARCDARDVRLLSKQVDELRDDYEADAIRSEIDSISRTLEGLKLSPILAPKASYSRRVAKAKVMQMKKAK